MNMKKILTFFTAATMVLGMFSGCGNGGAESSVSVENSSETGSEDEMSSEIEKTPETDEEWTEAMMKKAVVSYGNTDMMQKVIKKAQSGKKVTIAYLGGSITEGISAGAEDCYAKLSYKHFAEKYGTGDNVEYCNAGLSGTPSKLGIFRLDRDVLSSDPDICFIEFAVNDSNDPEHQGAYESIVRTLLGKNIAPVLLFSVTKDDYSAQDYMKEIGEAYDLPMISYRNTILDTIEHGDITWKDISGDNIHPNVPGHKIVAQLLKAYIADVDANLDSISGEESDFSTPATKAGFENGTLLSPSTEGIDVTATGSFRQMENPFGGFNGFWLCKGTDLSDSALTFKVNAKNIGLLFGKYTSNGCSAEIYVDDELVSTISADFTGGWGNYVECVHLKSFDTAGDHIVKIVPKGSADSGNVFSVTALAIA